MKNDKRITQIASKGFSKEVNGQLVANKEFPALNTAVQGGCVQEQVIGSTKHTQTNVTKGTVLQVGKFFYPETGGIETVTKLIAEGLQKHWQTDILCFGGNKGTRRRKFGSSTVIECGHLVSIASTPISFSFFYQFFKLRNKYDILHIHVPNPIAVLALLLFRPKGKVVVQWHSDILSQKHLYRVFKFFERRFLHNADLILATSPNYITDSKPLLAELPKVVALPLSIDTKELPFSNQLSSKIRNEHAGKTIIFSLGRFVYYKGFEYLIKAATFLDDQYVILIGGSGKLKQQYLNLISEYKLEKKVFIIDAVPQDQLGSYYHACDIFCLPSCEKTEAFGVVLLEAMSFGKPVVAVNIPGSGVSWVNQHFQTGLNVSVKNPNELAEAIRHVQVPENALLYGKNAKKRFLTCFSKENMISLLMQQYRNVLKM